MYNDAELEQMLLDPESHLVERKESTSDRSKIRKTICAFANDLPGTGKPGVIFLGAKDDGSCAGLPITDELIQIVAHMRSDGNILPLPSMVVEKRVIRRCEMLAILVQPSDSPPVRYQGQVWVRVGSTLQLATPEEEKRLSERRRSRDLPFDSRPVEEATLESLDLDFFRRTYLPSAISGEVLAENQRGLEQQLQSLRFLSVEGKPTHGALLGFGKDPLQFHPGAYVQFVRFDGTAMTDPVKDQKQISGPLLEVLSTIDEVLNINISTESVPSAGPVEIRAPDYPVGALRQLARNAVMHRSYELTNAPVRLYWFADRVEITNPGGLYGQVTKENLGAGATDYRNPLLAEFMRVLGYVQRFGIGIPLAQSELQQNGNPPVEFQIEPTYFCVIVRRRA
ncbi:MAG: putative DNA binding domain-containing protein [Candidatus Sumerlaeota bacterium]|nr:putative DNA binding domain-containing protein [Candidatus Sumerlaeota bacterium]